MTFTATQWLKNLLCKSFANKNELLRARVRMMYAPVVLTDFTLFGVGFGNVSYKGSKLQKSVGLKC